MSVQFAIRLIELAREVEILEAQANELGILELFGPLRENADTSLSIGEEVGRELIKVRAQADTLIEKAVDLAIKMKELENG